MAVRPPEEMASNADDFVMKVRQELDKLEKLRDRLRDDEDFQNLWSSDSAAALREVGINPDARMELGHEPYDRGPECTWCITPMGNSCHC